MDNTSYLKQLAEAEKKQKQTELAQAKTQALTDIGRAEATAMPQFQKQKQQTNVQSQIGAKNFAEFLAQRGQTRAGLSSQAELLRQNVLGRQLGDIGTAEAQQQLAFNNQRGDVNTAYQSDLTKATGSIDSWLREQLLAQRLQNQEIARQAKAARTSSMSRSGSGSSRVGKITKLEGTTLDRNAVLGTKGVPDATGKKMIWSIPQSDGSITQVAFAKGVNPFTGTTNKDARNAKGQVDANKVFSNGYQPNNIGGVKLKNTGKKTTQFGQEQNIYKLKSNYYVVWDGANNKYIRV